MDFQSLLTLFGLLAAVYALLPPERRLDFKLRLDKLDWLILVASGLALHYLAFYTILDGLGLGYSFGPWRWGFNAENTSYVIILTAIGVV